MSITTGFEIRRKDPAKERPFHERPYVSWKSLGLDMWIMEWLNRFTLIPDDKTLFPEREENFWSVELRKSDLLRMANDLITCQFNVCPEAYYFFEGRTQEEYLALQYGKAFRELAERLQDDEILVYYDCGN